MNLRFNTALRQCLAEAHDVLNMGDDEHELPESVTSEPDKAIRVRLECAHRMGYAQGKLTIALKMLGKGGRNGR